MADFNQAGLPMMEVPRSIPDPDHGGANAGFRERKPDWRRIAVVRGQKVVLDRRLSEQEMRDGGVPDDASIIGIVGEEHRS